MKKKLKSFFTLKHKANDGFTLVELIVVIAILAILGGVAVPAYSGYVKKANMQADISLVSDIEHALTLAYYNQDLTDGTAGFIMLSPNEGESMADEEGYTVLAMEKVFGSNWMDVMQLKYDGWTVKNMSLSYEDATSVVNSNFVQNYTPEQLMGQVQSIIDSVNHLNLTDASLDGSLYEMFNYSNDDGEQNALLDVMNEYGLGNDWNALSDEQQSNVAVLATASSVTNGNEADVSGLVPNLALFTAYAAVDSDFGVAYENFQNTISTATSVDDVKTAYRGLCDAAGSDYETWKTANGNQNIKAFEAIMSGVGNAMKDNGDAIKADLGNAEMFTTGIGSQMYNDYLDSAYATAAGDGEIVEAFLGGDLGEGTVLIQYVVNKGNLYIADSLPVG